MKLIKLNGYDNYYVSYVEMSETSWKDKKGYEIND